MNTDWIAYLITFFALLGLLAIAWRKKKKGSCCDKSCSKEVPKK